MEISDKFIYRSKDFTFWRFHAKTGVLRWYEDNTVTDDPHYLFYQCDFDGNYDPDTDAYSEFSFSETQQDLEIVGSV